MNKICAVIPARTGSKGLPGKNYKMLAGKPLIEYSIDAALNSSKIDKVIVSTNSLEVIDIANNRNIDVIKRPEELCKDDTPMLPVLKHVLKCIDPSECEFSHILLLQPTCPFRTSEHIDEALELIKNTQQTIVSVYKVDDAHPGRMYEIKNNLMTPIFPDLVSINRQDLPDVYHRNGAIYITPTFAISNGSLYSDEILPYVMSIQDSINIDNTMDWFLAETIISKDIAT